MHIAVLIETFDPSLGGRERSTSQIIHELHRRGHKLTVIANRVPQAVQASHHFAQFIIQGGLTTRTAWGLARYASWANQQAMNSQFDVSLSMSMAMSADVVQPREGTVKETIARKIRMEPAGWRRLLARVATFTRPKLRRWLSLETQTVHHPRLKYLAALSHYCADQFRTHYPHLRDRIVMTPNAAQLSCPDDQQRQLIRQTQRQQLGFSPQHLLYLFVSMDPKRKGLPELLRAFPIVAGQLPKSQLLIVGRHDQAMRQHAQRQPHADHVHWLPPQSDMQAMYLASDVTVLPTWYDPSSKVVLESLLLGIPAITTFANGAADWVASPTGVSRAPSPLHNHDTIMHEPPAGRVIPEPDDPVALAQAMLALANPAERARCAWACTHIARHISMTAHVDRLEKILEQAALQRGSK